MSIDKIQPGDNLTQSKDLVTDNIEKLKQLFPEIVTEGKIDFKVLQDVLGEDIEEEDEYYRFTWAGKAQARREAHKPSTGTLRPVKEDSVDWDTTENLYIEGDNLEVLKLLQKSYAGKVKMIYIDPPYNTGKDFVYKDNYKDNLKNYQEVTGQVDSEGNKLSTNSDSDGRYHSNWLNMMYPRLRLARNLLKEDGVIFMSIDDNEVENLRKICDEVFGEDNFICEFIWKSKSGGANDSKFIAKDNEYVICFAKKSDNLEFLLDKNATVTTSYNLEDENGKYSLDRLDKQSLGYIKSLDFPIKSLDGKIYTVEHKNPNNKIARWRWGINTVKERYNELVFKGEYVYTKNYQKEGSKPRNLLTEQRFGRTRTGKTDFTTLFEAAYFSAPKPVKLIKYFIEITFESDDILLDFFSGSATSAQSLLETNIQDNGNRKFIQVQLPEIILEKESAYKAGYKTITEIGKERIRRAAKKIAEENPEKAKDLDLGFKVFKLDSSNIKGWDGNPENLQMSLEDAVSNIKTNRTEEDVLYEILLKYGLDLTLPIEEKTIEGKTVFNVGFGALFICLGDNLNSNVAEGIGKWKEELNPEICRVIFKDTGFTDVEKTNSVQTLKRFGITEIKSI